MDDINWAAWIPVLLVLLAFVIFCIVDIARHDVKYLPKWLWIVIALVSIPLGGIIYLLLGRDHGDQHGTQDDNRQHDKHQGNSTSP